MRSATDWISLTNATIVVDGTNYTGGSGTFTLFSPGGSLTEPSTAPQAINFTGYDVTFDTSGSDYVMSVMPTDLLTDPVVTVPNYSFEIPAVAGIDWSATNWLTSGLCGTYKPNTLNFNAASPLASPAHSNQTGIAETSTDQPGTRTFESAESLGFVSQTYTYTLTVALGHNKQSVGRAPDDYMIEILIDDATVASSSMNNAYGVIPSGGWLDLSTSFRATDTEHGKPLKVRLTHSSDDATYRQGNFDNVRVTSTYTPWGTVIKVQ